jgi:CYTH domain-containing protein
MCGCFLLYRKVRPIEQKDFKQEESSMNEKETIGNDRIPYEIERKFLIRYPDVETLLAKPSCIHKSMVQMYLLTNRPGETKRIRKVVQDGKTTCYYTHKKRLSSLRRIEEECEISPEEYEEYAMQSDPMLAPIMKDRYCIYENGVCYEIDVFPFWNRQAYLEIELTSENQQITIPDYVEIIREVSDDPLYSNRALAARIPAEEV